MNDPATISQVLAGDDAAYGQLVERYQRGLMYYCQTLMGDSDQAEDLAQEAFIRAYQKLERYDPKFSFSTWLYRIAHNLALNQLRRIQALPLAEGLEVPHADGVPAALEREAREAAVRGAVERLPTNYRSVVHLHYWEHLSYEEIAQVLAVPPSTIKTWLYRARQQLKKECHGIIG